MKKGRNNTGKIAVFQPMLLASHKPITRDTGKATSFVTIFLARMIVA
jgi:hypothetical protein